MSKHSGIATARLGADYISLKRNPVPHITAEPLPSNLLEWHYVIQGPEESAYEGGYYHGKLIFPVKYPFQPPSIYMKTPSGRFQTNSSLCLSVSDFHPETWNPAWSVATILSGLLAFMLEESPTLGSIESNELEKNITKEIKSKLLIHEEKLTEKAKMAINGFLPKKPVEKNSSKPDPIQVSEFINLLVLAGFAVLAWTVVKRHW